MNKLTGTIALSCLLALPTFASGYNGPGSVVVNSVADALKAKDDTRVELTGYLVKSLGNEEYLFSDNSGEVKVEIDDDLWHGITVSDSTKVVLIGEVDDDIFGTEIDVEQINLIAE